MTKVCTDCEHVVHRKEGETEPLDGPEDCPKCGGIDTVIPEEEKLGEESEEE